MMNSLTCIVLFFTANAFWSQILVMTQNDPLTLRKEPSVQGQKICSIPKGTSLLYAHDWTSDVYTNGKEGWVKVRFCDCSQEQEQAPSFDYTGWVSFKYISTEFFKTTLLESFSISIEGDDIDIGCYSAYYGVQGFLGIREYVEGSKSESLRVKLKGRNCFLSQTVEGNAYERWEGSGLKIEFFGANTDEGLYFFESKGVLRIEYNGKVEYIYAAFGAFCFD